MKNPYAKVYFSPNQDTEKVIIGFLDRCKTFVNISVYCITHEEIANAIIRAHNRGVKVRVLTDKFMAAQQHSVDEKLKEAGVDIRVDKKDGSMHHKFICDGKRAVGTGSFNWTQNAADKNAENFVVIRLKYLVEDYNNEFDRLWELNKPE